jgi:energy-coupling factor transporter ATP-binding protein EcfA2
MSATPFADLNALAAHLRQELENKKFILLYAYNGTGKTRLSTAFKDLGKQEDARDTLYFNAFTEDLFFWDNDLKNDRERVLKINRDSRFFAGLEELEMDNRIRPLLNRYADFDFKIDTDDWEVSFSREIQNRDRLETVDDIKISRGEENVFIWCFFLAIVQLVLDKAEAYKWVKYIYIDDPISSVDEHNAIVVANHLVQLFRDTPNQLKTVISTHHVLFFNVLSNEIKNLLSTRDFPQYFLSRSRKSVDYLLFRQKSDTPFFHHVAALVQLYEAAQSENIYTHHFNTLRSILEKTAVFHGYGHFSSCIKKDANDADGILYQRFVDLLSHGKYSLYEPQEMGDETKGYFQKILNEFLVRYPFNPALFPSKPEKAPTS